YDDPECGFSDLDEDSLPDSNDNCPLHYNIDQGDEDEDGAGDACDNCLGLYNPDQFDADQDGLGNDCDGCVYDYNPLQGDIDGDGVDDACDYLDTAIDFFVEYRDTNNVSYDNVTGGGTCNQYGCSDLVNERAYCPGPNYCVWNGNCYLGDGTAVLNIDAPDEYTKHEAMCVGFGWWDLDTGGEAGPTPLPGMEICEMANYTWTNITDAGVGEYEWSYDGWSCCGDDSNEYVWVDNTCHLGKKTTPKKNIINTLFRK
ncbi:MAG: hypothetical protein ABIE94_06765, partial [archaeon]